MSGPQVPIQIAEPGLGWQSSPFGIIPIGTSIAPDSDYAPAAVPMLAVTAVPAAMARVVQASVAQPITVALASPAPAHGPREVIKAARARVKEIRAELRTHAALQRELGELERLLRAAKQKPELKVRALRAS